MLTTEVLSIVAAAVLSMVIGIVWYHPRVFGSAWARMSGLSPETVASRGRRPLLILFGFVGSLVVAFVLSMQLFAETDIVRALARSFWLWLGFVAPILLGVVLWEGRHWKLYVINVGFWLVNIMAMAAVFTLL